MITGKIAQQWVKAKGLWEMGLKTRAVIHFCISSQDTSIVPGTEGMLGKRLFHDLPSEWVNKG